MERDPTRRRAATHRPRHRVRAPIVCASGCASARMRGLPLSADTVAAVRAAGALREDLGHHVEEDAPPVGEEFATDFLRYWALLAFVLHRRGSAALRRGLRRLADRGAHQGTERDASTVRADRVPGSHPSACAGCRATPMPGSSEPVRRAALPGHGVSGPPIGYLGPDVEFRTNLVRLIQFASIDAGPERLRRAGDVAAARADRGQGLPIGVHLAAPFGHERRLLEVALELEEAAPWPTRPGPAPGA